MFKKAHFLNPSTFQNEKHKILARYPFITTNMRISSHNTQFLCYKAKAMFHLASQVAEL